MNIFILSYDHDECAQFHNKRHSVKMILESAQMLCTAHRLLDGEKMSTIVNNRKKTTYFLLNSSLNAQLYGITHIGHPCVKWTIASSANYAWHYRHFMALCREYTFRTGKVHKCQTLFQHLLQVPPRNIPLGDEVTPFALAMPDVCKSSCAVTSYRKYYCQYKTHLAEWAPRSTPEWFIPVT
jgi:hypothetical protein